MSDNKFIQRLKGKQTPKSVVEVQNDKLIASFTGVPYSTDVVGGIIDDKDSSIVVAKGAQNWKLDGNSLVATSSLSGDGADYTGEFNASGSGLWINAAYSLPATIFNAGTKWVLKLCGKNLLTTSGETIGFTLVVKVGNTHITSKTFTVAEGANVFCRQLAIDFSESEQAVIKAQSGDKLTLQLLCSDTNASATIYNGMTVFSALQRRVDGDAVVSDKYTFDELSEDLATHIANKNNPHQVTKTQVGLGNCDNTSDLDKPISTATQAALDGKVNKIGDTMSGALNIANIASSNTALLTLTHSNTATYKWNIAPRYNSTTLSVYPGSTETNGFRFATTGFVPASNNARYLGSASLKWKGVYTGVINNGYDIAVPVTNSADTFALESEITDINVKIPAQASTSNQLADKNFVNSSIATNTANFIGTFNSVADLEAYSGTVTNNDYAFVVGTDSAGNTTYNRYKYNATTQQWVYEYTLNNSSFTAEQWASINSGVTSSDVALARSSLQPGDLPTVGDGTITINQGGTAKGTFTVNQSGNTTIDLDAGGATTGQSIDAEIVGTLTITDNSVVSGFGTTNYLALPGVFDFRRANVASYEIWGSFVTPANVSNVSLLDGAITVFIESGKLKVALAGSTLSSSTTLATTTKYYMKFIYDGSWYALWLSTDGENYTRVAYASSGLGSASVGVLTIGAGATPISNVDMKDWNIKTNSIIIWQGMDAPGLHQKADIDLSNIPTNIDYVVESQLPTAQNNYTWYRKYKSGWVEQGGTLQTAANSLTFPIEMADTNYQWYANPVPQDFGNFRKLAATRATTGLTGLNNMYGTSVAHASAAVWDAGTFWEVKGMAAA